jgi:hypothetical protein
MFLTNWTESVVGYKVIVMMSHEITGNDNSINHRFSTKVFYGIQRLIKNKIYQLLSAGAGAEVRYDH